MKKILTTLLLVTSLSGVLVAGEARNYLRSEVKAVSVLNTLHPAMLQRWRRQRRRRAVRYIRRHQNNGRWNNQRRNRRWNNRRWNNRRRSGGGHETH